MAETKVKATKKAADKAPAKQPKVEERSLEQLQQDLMKTQQDFLDAKRSHQAGELVNTEVISTTRRQIARIHTAIKQAELKETN